MLLAEDDSQPVPERDFARYQRFIEHFAGDALGSHDYDDTAAARLNWLISPVSKAIQVLQKLRLYQSSPPKMRWLFFGRLCRPTQP